MRVVLDSNVLISARLEPRGPSAKLLRAWTEERFELIVSPQLLGELAGVLGRETASPLADRRGGEGVRGQPAPRRDRGR